jgi:hypothetical protein
MGVSVRYSAKHCRTVDTHLELLKVHQVALFILAEVLAIHLFAGIRVVHLLANNTYNTYNGVSEAQEAMHARVVDSSCR